MCMVERRTPTGRCVFEKEDKDSLIQRTVSYEKLSVLELEMLTLIAAAVVVTFIFVF